MFGLSGRVVAFYAAFAYPFALFCATFYFDENVALDPVHERRRLRRAQLLVFLAPIHVLFPITALGMVRDIAHLAEKPGVHAATRRRVRVAGSVGVVVSAVALAALSRAADG